MYYDNVVKALNKNKIEYAVAGGVAVVLYGYTRFTLDFDLMLELDEDNLGKFFDIVYKLGYRPKVPVVKEDFISKKKRDEWIKKKNMIVFSFYNLQDHLKAIDVFMTEPIKFSEIKKKIIKMNLKGLTIPAVSLEHLISLKEIAARPKDLLDLVNLREIKRLRNEKDKSK